MYTLVDFQSPISAIGLFITLLPSLETFWHIEPFPDIINDIYLTMNSVDYLGLQKCIYMMIMYTKYVQSVT